MKSLVCPLLLSAVLALFGCGNDAASPEEEASREEIVEDTKALLDPSGRGSAKQRLLEVGAPARPVLQKWVDRWEDVLPKLELETRRGAALVGFSHPGVQKARKEVVRFRMAISIGKAILAQLGS